MLGLGLALIVLAPLVAVASYIALWSGMRVANRTMEDLRWRVPVGRTVALVGPSGAG